jgi:hypothetical protein
MITVAPGSIEDSDVLPYKGGSSVPRTPIYFGPK